MYITTGEWRGHVHGNFVGRGYFLRLVVGMCYSPLYLANNSVSGNLINVP